MAALRTLFLACILGIAGCASVPGPNAASGVSPCEAIFRSVDEAVAAAGVSDGGASRIAGFPQLRVDRFLASYGKETLTEPQLREWVGRLRSLGSRATSLELANLPPGARQEIERSFGGSAPGAGVDTALDRCSGELTERDLSTPARLAALREAARVDDDYDTWKRVVGLYWITRLAFAQGIDRWHEEVRAAFDEAESASSPEASGIHATYVPPGPRLDAARVGEVLAQSSRSPLAIPDPRGDDAEALYRTFAPVFAVQARSPADVPGVPGWIEDRPGIVESRPVVFRRMSHARLEGRALLQIEYWLWFPERPRATSWDLLGGALDAVLWRVTLAPDGQPWVYDSIHACGCYHLFFPTARATARKLPDTLDETAFTPRHLPAVAAGIPVVLGLEGTTHYLRSVSPSSREPAGIPYEFRDDDTLRSIPRPDGGHASLFRPDGIVAGTERGERWLFWPMGIREPGAMRQWGRHATAFVGRRHFDDPGLIPQYFELH